MREPVAPDGSPVGFYTRFVSSEEPVLVHSAIPAGCSVLDLGCGGGRFAHPLMALGHPVVAVDQCAEMLDHVVGAEKVLAAIEGLDLGRTFGAVLLAANLVNLAPDDGRRLDLLRACARHVAPGGSVILQRLAPNWEPVPFVSEADGATVELSALEAAGTEFAGLITYGIGDERWLQPARWRLLDDDELERLLREAGLTMRRYLDQRGTWVEAVLVGTTADDSHVTAQREPS